MEFLPKISENLDPLGALPINNEDLKKKNS